MRLNTKVCIESIYTLSLLMRRIGEKAELDKLKWSNEYGQQHRPCLEGTRVNTLRAIREWANDETTTSRTFCLLDVAGSGKSTVAKKVVELFKEDGWLVAQFFFSRDTTETMSTRKFCSTVSNAFLGIDPRLKPHINKFKEIADWKKRSLEERYEGLVAGPLRELNRRAILIIDALDECANRNDREKLIETLRDKQLSVPSLRMFITGRSEANIMQLVTTIDGVRKESFQELEPGNNDVATYIRDRFKDLPKDEASRIQDRVIDRAQGLFIWARIACDMLDDSPDIDETLKELEGPLERASELDSIYRTALKKATQDRQSFHRTIILVLQMLLAMQVPLSIAELTEISPWSTKDVMERTIYRLGSLLLSQVPNGPIRLLHTTFREFLTSRERAGVYFIEPRLGHYNLAVGSLKILGDISISDINSFGKDSRR